jgi:6,7-dimethyl-8-ribityllumazine synthase
VARFLIVEARFYGHLNDMLVAGARDALEEAGHQVEVLTVPGALEVPGAIALAAESGRYEGFIGLGVVIRGETYHFEIVANESAAGIAGVQLEFGIPIGNGVLTCDSDSQAEARMDAKGYEAAMAALELANLLDAIDAK